MFIDLLLCIVGLAALVYAADKLVEAASNLALNLKFSKMLIGLSIIAIGTSLPELFVSLNSSLKGNPALSLGNIIGSNIMNIALILGISAIILPINSTQEMVKREVPFMIAVTCLFWIFAKTDSKITPYEGIILILVFIIYNIIIYHISKKESKLTEEYIEETNRIIAFSTGKSTKELIKQQNQAETSDEANQNKDNPTDISEPEKPSNNTGMNILCIVGGLIGLIIGSELLVKSAINIATACGVSNEIIGLTLVAIGTSIPELATSVIASKKGQSEISVGNVLGSNIFNITVIVGIVAVVPLFYQNPDLNLTLEISQQMLTLNIPIIIVFSVVLLPIMLTDMMISRKEGAFFLIIYICYTIMLIQGSINKPAINNNNPSVVQEKTLSEVASPTMQLPSK